MDKTRHIETSNIKKNKKKNKKQKTKNNNNNFFLKAHASISNIYSSFLKLQDHIDIEGFHYL